MVKCIIFDWSGTLVDEFDIFCKVCSLMFKELGREPISNEEIREEFTTPYMKFWNKYFSDLTKERQDELYVKFRKQFGIPDLFLGVKDTLRKLQDDGYKLFILSSEKTSKLLSEVEKNDVYEFFVEVIGDAYEKENCIFNLLEKYDLDKDSTFYVGDTCGDVEAGKSCGIKTIGISWGLQNGTEFVKSNPDFLIDDIREIEKIILL